MNKFRKVCVLGLGYIGLPTAATIASKSTKVFGVDVNADIVNTVNRGEIHIYEPNLKKIVHEKVKKGQLIARGNGRSYGDSSIGKKITVSMKNFNQIVKPNGINLDSEIDPVWARNKLKNVVLQGGLNPNILLTDRQTLKKETIKYLEIFKDHPYIFNLGHGILPETNPEMVEYLVKTVKEYK